MRRANRVFLIALFSLTLGGCETSSFWDGANNASDRFQDVLSDFNPFGTAKKPLPGDRRAVFPEGVPGVQQGVPPELMRNNNQPGVDAPAQPAPAPPPAAAAAAEPKAKSKKVAKSKAQTRSPAASSDPPDDEVWPPPPRR